MNSMKNDHGSLYVMRDSTFIDTTFSQVNEMAVSAGYKVSRNPVTPALDEFESGRWWNFQRVKVSNKL